MDTKTKVTFSHVCPVCSYETRETYLKESCYIQTQGVHRVSFDFIKEKEGKTPFDRFYCNGRVLLGCPNCGVVNSKYSCEERD